jgi:hypothetical protein
MACTIVVGQRRHSGFVLDVSATGLFVQTSASPPPGSQVEVELSVPGERDPVHIRAAVARRKVVPPRLRTVAHGGVGLQIQSAPEAYFTMIAALQEMGPAAGEADPPEAAAPKQAKAKHAGAKGASDPAGKKKARPKRPRKLPPRMAPPPPRLSFRVRIQQGARSRRMNVVAATEEDARRQALAEAGSGWKVLGCDQVAN